MIDIKVPPVILDLFVSISLYHTFFCPSNLGRRHVGYLNFDEDGGASDGIDDEIEYEYFEIIERLKDYVAKQKQIVDNESEIVEIIKEFIDWYFEFKKKFSPSTNYKGLDFFFYLGNINFNYQN